MGLSERYFYLSDQGSSRGGNETENLKGFGQHLRSIGVIESSSITRESDLAGNLDPVPDSIARAWRNCLEMVPNELIAHYQLPTSRIHVASFTDASEDGFGAVAYLRTINEDGQVELAFVFAKSRVSPLSFLSILRLDLQGAITGLRLALTCSMSLGIPMDQRQLSRTDSNIMLQWISSENCRFTVFVANRVAEIRESSSETQWRHVSGR